MVFVWTLLVHMFILLREHLLGFKYVFLFLKCDKKAFRLSLHFARYGTKGWMPSLFFLLMICTFIINIVFLLLWIWQFRTNFFFFVNDMFLYQHSFKLDLKLVLLKLIFSTNPLIRGETINSISNWKAKKVQWHNYKSPNSPPTFIVWEANVTQRWKLVDHSPNESDLVAIWK